MPLDGVDDGRLPSLRPESLNGSRADGEALAQMTCWNVGTCGVDCGSTRTEHIGRTTAEIGERQRGRSRVGEDVEIERRVSVEGARRELSDEILPADPGQMHADASDQRRLEDAQPEEVGQARSFTGAIEVKLMPRVLPMSVVEGVVRVLLIVERSDAGACEAGAEAELPHERRLDVACKRPRGGAVRREHRMNVVVGGAEREEAALLPLRQHDSSDGTKRGRCRGDRPIVLKPDRDVKSDGVARQTAIVRGTIETIVGRSIAGAMSS